MRRIWVMLLGVLLLALVGAAGVAIGSARDTLRMQLRLRNADHATALALTLAASAGDAASTDRTLGAAFDTGLYRRIRYTAPDGATRFAREAPPARTEAPPWFVERLGLSAPPGTAQVSTGGTLEVAGQAASVDDELWNASQRIALTLGGLALLAGVLARLALARTGRALDAAMAQARALLDGRFVTVDPPLNAAPELRRLTLAMNAMVRRLRQGFDAQARQVEALRREANTDPATGLANRQHFMRQLAGLLHGEDGNDEGGLVMLRVGDLAALNRLLGYATTDRMIAALAQALQAYTQHVPGCRLGRLNGSDFALALPAGGVALETAQAVSHALSVVLPSFGHGVSVAFGAVEMKRDMPLGPVMAAADTALAHAESLGPFACAQAPVAVDGNAPGPLGEGAWRQRIQRALDDGRLRLVEFPVLDERDRVLHFECPLRLELDPGGAAEPAARWLPLALRARLTAAIDERAVALALEASARDGLPRGVNVAGASLVDSAFGVRLRARLRAAPEAARALWLELPESAAADHFDALQDLALQLRPMGCRIGLEHAGERLARIDRLVEAGLDYVKLDAAVVQGVRSDEARAHHVQSLVALLHGLSIAVIAEGVTDAGDAQSLWRLGVDAITGPWASRRHAERPAPAADG